MTGDQQRDPALDEIVQAYRDGTLVLFVGAGLSVAAGLPSPLALVERAVDHARKRGVDETALAEITELAQKKQLPDALWALRLALGPVEFSAFIERTLDDGPTGDLPPLALALGDLAKGLRGVLTTNLDLLVERAFAGAWPALARATADVAQRRRFILKLHGTLADRSTWVLTREDYERALHLDEKLQQALGALFNACHLLFVGYDLDGDDFAHLLGRVSAFAGPQPPRHFALVPAGTMGRYRKHRLEEAGVRLVIYDDPAGSQGGLVEHLEVLAASLGPESSRRRERRTNRAEGEEQRCPFPGLEVFDRDRAGLFFGRDAEISEAVQELGDGPRGHRRWLQIEGPSGVGKSSLTRAGVVPAVEKGWVQGAPNAWRVAVVRPGVDPVLNLAKAVRAAVADRVSKERSLGAIIKAFRKREDDLATFLREYTPPDHGFLLVVDQLEEAFAFAGAKARKTFDRLLASAVRDKGGPLYLLTTIRSDFVGRMSALPEMERLLNAEASRYLLKAMSSPELRAAIVEPAKRAGLRWESGLSEKLLDDASSPEGGLPLLAHVLQALWAKRKKNLLTHVAYRELGGLGGALTQSADAIVEALGKEGRERAKRLLLRLVKIGRGAEDTRRTTSREEAIEAAGGGEVAERVLARLSGTRDPDKPEGSRAEARLLVVGQGDGEEGRVDLVHEALLRRWKTLRGWIDEGRKALERRDDLEAASLVWEAAGSPLDGLPSGAQLAYLQEAEAAGKLARKFLEAALVRERRRIRQGRLIVAGLSAGVVAFGGLAAFAVAQRDETERQRNEAEQQRKVAERRLEDAIDVADQVVFVIDRKLEPIAGTAEVRKELLKRTSQLQDRLIAGAGDSKKALRSRMVAHGQRGLLAQTHDDLVMARQEYEAALVIANKLLALDPQNADFQRDSSVINRTLGDLATEGGDLSAARSFFDKSLELIKTLTAAYPNNAIFQRDLSASYERLGNVAKTGGDTGMAHSFYSKALELRKVLAAADPQNAALQSDLIGSYTELGDMAQEGGDLDAARGFFDKALELRKILVKADPHSATLQHDLSNSYEHLGEVAQAEGDLGKARDFYDEALGLRKTLVAADPHDAHLQRDLSVSYNKLGALAKAGGDLGSARNFFEKALELTQALAAADPHHVHLQRDLSIAYTKLGDLADSEGDFIAAHSFFDKALELRKMLVAANPQDADLQIDLATSHAKLIGLAIATNDWASLHAHHEKATSILDHLDSTGLSKGHAEIAKLRAILADIATLNIP